MKKLLYLFSALVFLGGAFLAGSWYSNPENSNANPSDVKLPAVYAEKMADTDTLSLLPGGVKINPKKQQLIGVKIATVEKKSDLHTLRALGRVVVDDRRVHVVNSAATGWVREVSPITVGSFVQKDQALAVFYSPEFLAAEQSYFYALNALDRFMKEESSNINQLSITKANIRQYSDTLRNLGMGEKQIDEIGKSRNFTDLIKIASPSAGIVISRNIYSGQRFERGTEFFKITDLRSVWILVDTFENEVRYLNPGVEVKVFHPHLKKTFQAKITADLPQFDPFTRTLKVRLEADNPEYLLRADMFVDIELPIQVPETVTVQADAIIDSGLRKTVFVDQGNGYFEPREVETGLRMGNRVEIVRGLEAGEKIAISGTFLIDSESKLELAAQGMYTTLSRDPVCGAEVSRVKAEKEGRKIAYRGKTYYLDSEECRQKFEKEPERYVKE